MLVWVNGWQMQCCGDPFSVGSDIEWTLYATTDRDWLDTVLGPNLSAQVTHGEDHHECAPWPTKITQGKVRRIRAVSSAFGSSASDPNASVLVPIPGTAQLYDVKSADGWFPDDGRLLFNGYLVDVDPA